MRVFIKEYKHTQKLFAKTFSNPKINKDKLSIKQRQKKEATKRQTFKQALSFQDKKNTKREDTETEVRTNAFKREIRQ